MAGVSATATRPSVSSRGPGGPQGPSPERTARTGGAERTTKPQQKPEIAKVWGGQDSFQRVGSSKTSGKSDQVTRTEGKANAQEVKRDPSLKKVTDAMLKRLQQGQTKIDGQSAESLFRNNVLNNPKITDDMLRKMGKVTLDQVKSDPKDRAEVLKRHPNVQQTNVHKLTTELMSGITGIDPKKLSNAVPSLGVTGTLKSPVFYLAKDKGVQLSTALHDVTDTFRGVGIQGVNKAVWGSEGMVSSALRSYFNGVPVQ